MRVARCALIFLPILLSLCGWDQASSIDLRGNGSPAELQLELQPRPSSRRKNSGRAEILDSLVPASGPSLTDLLNQASSQGIIPSTGGEAPHSHMSDTQLQAAVRNVQSVLDEQHLMPDQLVNLLSQYSSYLSTPDSLPPTPQSLSILNQFLAKVHVPGVTSKLAQTASVGSRPAAPADLLMGISNVLWVLQAILLMPLLQIPALVQMFIEPTMMAPPPSRAPAAARPRHPDEKIYHAYGQYGDYGYEHQGYKGYGCASGKCAPWWWTWRKKSPYYPFIGRDM